MKETVVVAVGGNAIIRNGQRGTLREQSKNLQKVCAAIVDLVERGYRVAVTHGNGPQVGNELLKNEAGRIIVPPYSLDVCGAETSGSIGYLLTLSLRNQLTQRRLDVDVVTVITNCVVDEHDPGFDHPTKPIGPFYSEEDRDWLVQEKHYVMMEDSGRGFRRVVSSPKPLEIVERKAIRDLIDAGNLVICCGGGGIPVVKNYGIYQGVEAVIDKDYASALLAKEIGADVLMLLTGVEKVAIDFGKPEQRELDEMTLEEAKRYMAQGQFPAGSMGPKVDAARLFVEASDKPAAAIITLIDKMPEAMERQTGTRIVRERS
ncbi:MAG: carbamate kinase [Clostridiales bacterium]|nr:carbamate kinase [Clostridiales bacterium]